MSALPEVGAGTPPSRSAHQPEDFETIGFREFPPTTDAVVAARRFVRRTLASRGADTETIATAELVTDELALNAVRHAGTFFSVAVEIASAVVRIAVRDDSGTLPRLHAHSLESISGRGLSIIAMTAEQWGTESLGRGKEVWAELS
jgi:anti-sigma regulatory factor (Ser/Thr protein kinase)